MLCIFATVTELQEKHQLPVPGQSIPVIKNNSQKGSVKFPVLKFREFHAKLRNCWLKNRCHW